MKILFAASEATPLAKTGGLADVAGSLPPKLRAAGLDARLILPAYPGCEEALSDVGPAVRLSVPGAPAAVEVVQGHLADTGLPVLLVRAPVLFQREGSLYLDARGREHWDNALRFGVFCRAVTAVANGQGPAGWRPDVVHCNDWQTGLVPPLLAGQPERPATLFTIHNLAYQGLFDYPTFLNLELPAKLWSSQGLEFYDQLSFIKGGLAFADRVTTVSPTYAEEICSPALGYGLEGLLQHRREHLSGILNGIDTTVWDPARDPLIAANYDAGHLAGKAGNKTALQQAFGLPQRNDVALFGHIGRLVEQKGTDLIIDVLPTLLQRDDVQLVILGAGDPALEAALRSAAARHPGRLGITLGYDEPLAHLIEAGSNSFLMPSRFEPCGLNQLYSLRYGAVPIVHRTGGLADTVVDASEANCAADVATGFVFTAPTAQALQVAIDRALARYATPGRWRRLALRGMAADFSWQRSAAHYITLYEEALSHPAAAPV